MLLLLLLLLLLLITVCMQYHDGFMLGEQYPADYNALAEVAVKEGRIARSPTCPDL